MDEQYWREKFSKLDLERQCSASEKSCWLYDDLENWNSVLNALQLDLTDWQVGKMQLRTKAGHPCVDLEKWNTSYSGTFLLAWLPTKHHCIEAISFGEGYSHPHVTAVPDSITRRSSNLHHISITGDAPFDWALVLDDLCPIQQLETLEVRNGVKVSRRLSLSLAQIVTENSSSVKTVDVSEVIMSCIASNILMRAISRCHTLQQLTLGFGLHPAGLSDLVTLLQSTQTLRTLHLVEGISSDTCSTESDENDADDGNNDDVLLESPSLESLNHQLLEVPFTKILPELENNSAVTCLIITGWDMEPIPIGPLGALLKSVLSKNHSLRSLILKDCYIEAVGARQLSDGLRENETLECLDVSACDVRSSAGQVLCSTLNQNTSLRLLKIGYYRTSSDEREALSMQLARNQWYGRVQLRWIEKDTAGLISAMLDPLLSPTELQLYTKEFSDESFEALCSALTSSDCIKALTVYLCGTTSPHVTSLRQMLEKNEHLRSLTLHEGYRKQGFAVIISQALSVNKSLNDLTLVCYEMSSESAELLATLLKTNENLHKFILVCEYELARENVDVISQGLLQNLFITEVSIGCTAPAIRSAVQRNVSLLHRATSFVLGQKIEKSCAEAFEILESKASLISCLKSVSRMTEIEARTAVLAARTFISSNYFFINQIVFHKIECYAKEGTQMDKLNFECLVAIAKHLKVSDVCT